jgi:hypothetical protein
MHRSGTSFVASQLAARGVSMGDNLLPADSNNVRGYFEDVQFLELQRRMLQQATLADDGGHRDWGWTESERLDRASFGAWRDQAAELLEASADGGSAWGWKDPRTSLLLDFWLELAPDARFVLVYRPPWDVADSMQRLGADVFLRRPDYAYRIWEFYNRHLLDFRRRHPERSLLVSAAAAMEGPERLGALLAGWAVGSGEATGGVPEGELFHSIPAGDPLVELASVTHPGAGALLADLEASADLVGPSPSTGARPRRWRLPGAEPTPRLAVVVPCYDLGELVVEAVASAERSIEEPYELVVVDDGSTDERTREVLAALAAHGVPVVHQENRGLGATRNRGFELTRAPFVFPLDADNRLLPGFVGPALELLESEPRAGVAYGDRVEFGLRSGRVEVPEVEQVTLLAGNYIDACAVIRRDLWRQAGGFDGAMPRQGWEDWDLWLGALERGWELRRLPLAAFEYRVRPGSMITAFADEAARRPVLCYVADKHAALFERGLAELVLTAQRYAEQLWKEARRAEDLGGELARVKEQDRARQAELAASVEAELARASEAARAATEAVARVRSTKAELDGAGVALQSLVEERKRLEAELERWRDRVAAMERTRAWRWRARLLKLRRAFGRA